jgi:hypothetical protein
MAAMSSTPVDAAPTGQPETAAAQRLFSGRHLPLVLGVIGLVTLGAFENRAVGTALPTMVREFDALGSFGLANAAPNASYLISLAVAGLWADRRGPIPTLRAGAITFALAQLLVGTATAMPMVVAGRLLSGLAEGLLDVALMVVVARTAAADVLAVRRDVDPALGPRPGADRSRHRAVRLAMGVPRRTGTARPELAAAPSRHAAVGEHAGA